MDFFQQYFVDPIVSGSGYNIYNTAVYAVLLIAAAFVVFKVIRKLKIEVNNNFLFGVIPFVVLGGLARAMQDAGIIKSFWFITPLIYVTVFAIAFVSLVASKISEKFVKFPYYRIWFCIGAAAVLIFLVQVSVKNVFALEAIFLIALLWTLIVVFVKKMAERYVKKFPLLAVFTWENTALLAVHMFDATTTFVALTYFPYFEEHVLPSLLIGLFGPAVMFALKFVVVGAVLYAIDKEVAEKQQRKFVKLVILILGLAPGLRNFFRLVMGV